MIWNKQKEKVTKIINIGRGSEKVSEIYFKTQLK